MKYTVGIITYQRAECVERLLKSLLDQEKRPDEIVIVDDSESEETAKVIEEFKENSIELNSIHRQGKTIQGNARNKVIEESKGDVICFVDDDTEVEKTWLKAISETYEGDGEVAAVAGPALMVNEDKEMVFEPIENDENQNWFNKWGETSDYSDRWIPSKPVETHRFVGANMSFRKEKLEEYGGFSDEYKGNGFREEDAFMVKLWKNNEKMIYHPEAKLYHYAAPQGGSRGIQDKELLYWKGRNLMHFIKENFPKRFPLTVIKLAFKSNDSDIPPFWIDFARMIKNRKFKRRWKFKGYVDGII